MTTLDKVEELIHKHPGSTAIEIARMIFGPDDAYQPRVNPSCLILVQEGRIKREGRGGRGDPFRYYPL